MILVMFKHCLSKNDISMKSLYISIKSVSKAYIIQHYQFPEQKSTDLRVKTWKYPPPFQNMGGYITPIPPVIYALGPKPGSLRYCTVKLQPFGYTASEFNYLFSIT